MAAARTIREEMQKRIDAEVKELVDEGYETAKRILTEKRDDLERLAQGLLEYETLTGDEIKRVVAGEPLNRNDDGGSTPPSGNAPSSVTAIPKAGRPKPGPEMEPDPA
jgi:cell division protease FtsH